MSEREAIVSLIETFTIVAVGTCVVGALIMVFVLGRLLLALRSEHMKGIDDE